jgi:hypothetical protein
MIAIELLAAISAKSSMELAADGRRALNTLLAVNKRLNTA